MRPKFTCPQIARAKLGSPAKTSGAELLFHCPNHDDRRPSLSVNPAKNVWLCGPCGASGGPWALAAFLAHVDAADKRAVISALRKWGLLK